MNAIPRHIGIIMDGNRTWARALGLDPAEGYRAGCLAIPPVAREAARLGISALTLYTFSVDNWQRPKAEIDAIFTSLIGMLTTVAQELAADGIAIRTVGDLTPLPSDLRDAFATAEYFAPSTPRTTLAFALNYGGREDIVQAMRSILAEVESGHKRASAVTAADVEHHLSTSALAPLDLIIRTAGQQRLSNFLLWQAAYAELAFDERTWPEFTAADLQRHVDGFGARNRSFGR